MFQRLAKFFHEKLDIDTVRMRAEAMNAMERVYGQSNFLHSAFCVEQFLKAEGFQNVQSIPLICDGKTPNLDCVMPQAWDRTGRTFFQLDLPSLSYDDALICDSDKHPFATGMWSYPTPAGGISGQVVDWDQLDPENPDVAGKIVLLMRPAYHGIYWKCMKAGAKAILLCDAKAPTESLDEYRWANGHGPIGWYAQKGDIPNVHYNITPRKAFFLKSLLANGGYVSGHGEVKTKVYDGELRTVTGLIPGKSQKEIVLVAHIYEPFVADDAAGACQAIAVATAIRDLAAQGALPALEYSIRVVVSAELYGFSQWFSNPTQNAKSLHVFSFDSTCHCSTAATGVKQVKFRLSHDRIPAATDWIMERAYQAFDNLEIKKERGNLSDDTFVSEPGIGLPSNWLHSGDMLFHHNSGWQFSGTDWELARIQSSVTAVAVASLCCRFNLAPELPNLCNQAVADFQKASAEVARRRQAGEIDELFAADLIRYQRDVTVQRLLSLNAEWPGSVNAAEVQGLFDRLAEPELQKYATDILPHYCAGILKQKNMVIQLKTIGTLVSWARVPYEEKRGCPAAPALQTIRAFCTMDGSRTLYEAVRLSECYQGKEFTAKQHQLIVDAFRWLEKYGYVAISPKYRTKPEELCEALVKLGVHPNMQLVIHSSYSALGDMAGGPDAVVKMLKELITEQGTIIMPAFNFFRFPPNGIFEPALTNSFMGAITEEFRKSTGVFRSLNPTHSFAAWGKDAEAFVQHHHEVCVHGEGSPLDLLARNDGYALMIQCPESVTYMHNVEFEMNPPCLRAAGEAYPVKYPDGTVKNTLTWSWRAAECKHNDLHAAYHAMRQQGMLREIDFANAHILLFKLQDFRKCYLPELQGPEGCRNCKVRPRVVAATVPEN